MASMKLEKLPLHQPPPEQLTSVLQNALAKNFAEVYVKVVDCPNLKAEPFNLVAEGLGGNPKLIDIGGVGNLLPTVKLDKVYDLDQTAEVAGCKGAFLIGAGAGPYKTLGFNTELIANLITKGGPAPRKVGTHAMAMTKDNSSYTLYQMSDDCTDFLLMGNFLACDGKPGKVIEVRAKNRTGELSLVDAMRFGLKDHYGTLPVGLGGAFAVLQGKAHMHIMPNDFPKTPMLSKQDVDNWLYFYDMPAPLVCVGIMISHDPGFDLRPEHFHGYGKHGVGGHYHWDSTPDEVEYLGYFVTSDTMYRIDRAVVDEISKQLETVCSTE